MSKKSTKLKDMINEHYILGELPSSKLKKMKWNPVTGETMNEDDTNEGKINEAKFNISAKSDRFGKMVKDILKKKPGRKYLTLSYEPSGDEIYGTISDAPVKAVSKFYEEESVEEAAPRMKTSKETENIKKVYMALSGLKKAGGSGRYGKEFDSAKKKALKAMNDMLSYSKIGG